MTRLRELLSRLMPELLPRVSTLAASSNPRLRYVMQLVLQDYARATQRKEK
jgi:hypothetical protein